MELIELWCNSGCSGKTVAENLAFHPPDPPSYRLAHVRKPAPGGAGRGGSVGGLGYEWILDSTLRKLAFEDVSVAEITTDKGNVIPVFTFSYPGAFYTLLVSHGNAADCGVMREVFIDLCINLRVNVVAYDYTGTHKFIRCSSYNVMPSCANPQVTAQLSPHHRRKPTVTTI
jgi:hypothetical protein